METSSIDQQQQRRRYRLERVGCYDIGKTIGRGNFADVKLGRHDVAKCKVAIKIVDKKRVDADNLAKIDREIRILKCLHHPHIIELYQVIRLADRLYIVTEYAGGGELFEVLVERGKVDEHEGRRLFQQTTSAVAYCHAMGVVHRDLKAENLLLDKNNNIKLIDFGFSNFQLPNHLLSTWCGSPPYAAPELYIGREYDGCKADIWSLGVVLYILVSGGFPFPGNSMDKLKRAVLSGQVKIPYWVSVECSDLIRKMLVVNPAKRYSIHQVVQHRWFTHNMSNKMETLIEESINPATSAVDAQQPQLALPKSLNGAVLHFLLQHTRWTEEQITRAVIEKDFESPLFATYTLLCDKLSRHSKDKDMLAGNEQPRRGSRGSILSGKVNVEPDQATAIIPAHHLAKLNLSTSPEPDSDDSSNNSSAGGDDQQQPKVVNSRRHIRLQRQQYANTMTSTGTRNAVDHHQLQQPPNNPLTEFTPSAFDFLQQRTSLGALTATTSGLRRHTLCETMADPSASALLAMPFLVGGFIQPTHGLSQLPYLLPALHSSTMQFADGNTSNGAALLLPNYPTNLRRSSDSERLFCGTRNFGNSIIEPKSGAQPPPMTIEEEGERYLRHFGGKRNTFHGSLTPPNVQQQLPTTYTNPSSMPGRHARTPYRKTCASFSSPSERRSSWTSTTTPLTGHQHAYLERLYRQNITHNEQLIGIQQLQREFQQLKANTEVQNLSPSRSGPSPSPPTSSQSGGIGTGGSTLDIIAEQEMELSKPTPRISITDENNRCLSGTTPTSYDPISLFEHQAQQIVFGQRPATVIGFSPSMPASGTISPDQQYYYAPIPGSMSGSGSDEFGCKSVLSPLQSIDVIDQLKGALDIMGIGYAEQQQHSADDNTVSNRLSIGNDNNGIRIEIGVADLHRQQQPFRSKIDFVCVRGSDLIGCDQLCSELIGVLQM